MTPERFRALADAYGGDVARWPFSEQEAAAGHLLHDPAAHLALEAAARLDRTLLQWTVPGPGSALAGRIAASVAQRHARRRRWRVWLSSLGAATALATGAAAGVLVVVRTVPPEQGSGSLYELRVLGAPLELDPSRPPAGQP